MTLYWTDPNVITFSDGAKCARYVLGKKLQSQFFPITGVRCSLSPDGSLIAVYDPEEEKVGVHKLLWDEESPAIERDVFFCPSMTPSLPSSFAWSADASLLAIQQEDGTTSLYRTRPWRGKKTGECLGTFPVEMGERTQVLLFSPQSKTKMLAAANTSGVIIWDEASDAPYRIGSGSVRCVAWSPDNKYLACGGDSTLAIYRRTHKRFCVLHWTDPSHIVSAAWSPFGSFLAMLNQEGQISLWKTQGKPDTWTFLGPLNLSSGRLRISALAWSPVWSPDEEKLAFIDNQKRLGFFTIAR
jgi:WD40 repeat protein